MTTKITPTIGRVILVWPREALRGPLPWCGLISGINENGTINIGGVTDGGNHVALQNVPIVDIDPAVEAVTPKPPHMFACWMPFQLGQAAKTEDAVGRLIQRVDRIGELLALILVGNPFFKEDLEAVAPNIAVPEWVASRNQLVGESDASEVARVAGADTESVASEPGDISIYNIGGPPEGTSFADTLGLEAAADLGVSASAPNGAGVNVASAPELPVELDSALTGSTVCEGGTVSGSGVISGS